LIIDCRSPESAPIEISYEGSLAHNCIGLFYVNDEFCVSHFEPKQARKAFPCFDERFAKSTFSYLFQTRADLTILTNVPVRSVTVFGNGYKHSEFSATLRMSTYLVAFVVGKFDRVTGETSRGLPVDVYASVGKERFLHYPLQEAIKAIEWFADFYAIPYELPRLQILGSPRFMFGGMENYGLIVIVEVLLTANEGGSPSPAPFAPVSGPEAGLFDMIGNARLLRTSRPSFRGRC
jgi:aminopeptidase N